MAYSVRELAELAGVTVRTLHHYDHIGLLPPSFVSEGKYRYYEEAELLRLQQILFFRELGFSLQDIKQILDSPSFNIKEALKDQKRVLKDEIKRLRKLVATIDQTMKKITGEQTMPDEAMFGGFDRSRAAAYAAEAKARWSHTEAYRQSQEHTQDWKAQEFNTAQEEMDALLTDFAACMHNAPESPEVQRLVLRLHEYVGQFYDCSLDMFRGLAQLYTQDKRFRATYEKYDKALPEFLADAMMHYCDTKAT